MLKLRVLSTLLVFFAAVALCFAQTTVTTSGGTTNFIPKFTGSSTINNSAITENNGNVGIGTTQPSEKLDVGGGNIGQIGPGGWLDIVGFTDHGWGAFGSNIAGNGDTHVYRASNYATRERHDTGRIFLEVAPSGTAGDAIPWTTGLMVNNSGYVGIATSVPDSLFDVPLTSAQWARFGNGPQSLRIGTLQSGSPFISMGVKKSGLDNNYIAITGNTAAVNHSVIELGYDGALRFKQQAHQSDGTILNPTENFTISPSGYIGIGNVSPAYALDVNGYVRTLSGIVFPNGTVQTTAAGGGTITGVLPGSGLTGGGYSGNVTLALDNTVPRTNYTNYFSGRNIFNGGLESTIGSTFRNTNLGTIVDFYSDYRQQWITTLYQNGDFATSGAIFGSYKQFRIDHPLDPANKYLQHTSVESPDMKTIYDGVVDIGPDGTSWVDLPDYFEGLNGDFRYQLTAIGAPAPNLHVAGEISGNRFLIGGGIPGMKVCWQVTGIRHDAYAKAYPAPVELKKAEPGTYLHPELFGQAVTPPTP